MLTGTLDWSCTLQCTTRTACKVGKRHVQGMASLLLYFKIDEGTVQGYGLAWPYTIASIGLESDDVTLVVVQYRLYDSLDLTRSNEIINTNKKKFSSPHFRFPLGLEFLDWHYYGYAWSGPRENHWNSPGPDKSCFSSWCAPRQRHVGLFFQKKRKKKMRIIGIFTALAISIASPSNNAATLERDTRAMVILDCKLLATATKVEVVLDVEREAKIAKEIPKRTRFLLQLLDNRALSTSFWLLRSVT